MGKNSIFIILLLTLFGCSADKESVVIWSSIHVSGTNKSGDAFLLKLPRGDYFLIDTSYSYYYETDLKPFLEKEKVEKLSGILVTHAHRNHYGALLQIVKDFPTKKVFFNLPDGKLCLKEAKHNRCNADHVKQVIEKVKEHSKVYEVKEGDTLISDPKNQLSLKVIHYAKNSISSLSDLENARFHINETSVVSKLQLGETSILFPGDIGSTVGKYLANTKPDIIKSTLLAAPHHGVTNIPPTEFFEVVQPKTIVASVSMPPIMGKRGDIIRNFAAEYNVPLYITGRDGSVQIKLTPNSFSVITPESANKIPDE